MRAAGLTLVEVLIVVAVMGLLAGVALASAPRWMGRGLLDQAAAELAWRSRLLRASAGSGVQVRLHARGWDAPAPAARTPLPVALTLPEGVIARWRRGDGSAAPTWSVDAAGRSEDLRVELDGGASGMRAWTLSGLTGQWQEAPR